MAVEYETLVQGGHSKFAEEIFRKIKDKALVDVVKGSDSVPYHFRKTPYGDRLKEKIIGGTVAWNQHMRYLRFKGSTSGVDNATINALSDNGNIDQVTYAGVIIGHILLSTFEYYMSNDFDGAVSVRNYCTDGSFVALSSSATKTTYAKIRTCTKNDSFNLRIENRTAGTFYVGHMQMFNLTQMFGSTIADYIYNLEQTTAGAGVALFRELFPKDYYEYDAGSLQSVSGLQSHDEVGFNQWDEEWEVGGISPQTGENSVNNNLIRSKNICKCLPNTQYYVGNNVGFVYWYDADGKYIRYGYDSASHISPSNANGFRIQLMGAYGTTYKNDVCINISDPSKNGTYEPYKKHSYPLDSSLTLRGVPKLVDNKIQFDGDIYESTGKMTRRYGIDTIAVTSIYEPTNPNFDFAVFTVSNIWRLSCYFFGEKVILGKPVNFNSATVSGQISIYSTPNKQPCVSVPKGTTLAQAQAMLDGTHILYELATPTTESAQPHTNPQRCVEGGTEEYVTTGIVPVGHESEYVSNKAERFDALPDVTSNDGDYVIRQTDGIMELVDVKESSKLVESESGNLITIVTDSAQIAKNTHLTFEPIQDLHGYDHPWPAGGGKNLLPMTVDGLKAANTSGTWNGNSYMYRGITATLLTDDGNNITGIRVNGTNNSGSNFAFDVISNLDVQNACIANGGANGGGQVTAYIQINKTPKGGGAASIHASIYSNYDSVNIDDTNYTYRFIIYVLNGNTANNLMFYPMVRLSSVSDATFEPYSNICPISGLDEVKVKRTGKNLLNMTIADVKAANTGGIWNENVYTFNGLTFTVNDDGTVKVNGTSTSYAGINLARITVESDYILSGCPGGGGQSTYFLSVGSTTDYGDGASGTFINNANVSIVIANGKTLNNLVFKPMIRYAEVLNDTFVPYQSEEVITESFPTTVYGGTLDLETGELMCDRKMVDLGTINWVQYNTYKNCFYAQSTIYNWPMPSTTGSEAKCSVYNSYYTGMTVSVDEITNQNKSGNIYVSCDKWSWSAPSIVINDVNYSDGTAEQFKAAMSGVQLVHELATPITYILTPQQLSLLKGMNRISTNAKSVKVTFRNGKLALMEDMSEVIETTNLETDKKLESILGNFASIETSPASDDHAIGDYLIYDNKLYKVIMAISAGESLTKGTNISRTTVMAELIALTQ